MQQVENSALGRLKKRFTPNLKTNGDPRLLRIWQILNLFGILSIKEGWKMTIRPTVFIALLLPSYIKDMVYFANKIMEWKFHTSQDVEVLTFAQTHTITAYRIYLLIRHREELKSLVGYITDVFPSWIEGDDYERKGILDRSVKKGMWIYYCHSIQLVTVGSLLILRPLLSTQRFALAMHLPIEKIPWIPLDKSVAYEIAYVFQVWSNSMEISVAFCMNMLFFTLLIRACGHMDCLIVDLDSLGVPGRSAKTDSQILKEFVDKYNTFERFTCSFNRLFYTLTAIQPLYTAVSVITSMLVYDGTHQTFSFVGIAVAHMLELFIYCYVGELTAEKSGELGQRLFGTPWYNLCFRDKKSVLQILHRCQKPFTIRAGIFGNFSREMFATLMLSLCSIHHKRPFNGNGRKTMKTTYSTWAVFKQAK